MAARMLAALVFLLPFSSSSQDLHAFKTLLRELDLNAETRSHYAITPSEYEQLKTAWNILPPLGKAQSLHGEASQDLEGTFAHMLVADLAMSSSYETHQSKMAAIGAEHLSLSMSRPSSRLLLETARKSLVDMLRKGPNLFHGDRLAITAELMEVAEKRAGTGARRRLEKWETLVNSLQGGDTWKQIHTINEFFNREILPVLDAANGKKNDYWQSPIETLVRGKGDCEDFAMAKYVSLRLLGIPSEQLRIALVNLQDRTGHAVILFHDPMQDTPWVLDNMTFMHLGSCASHILKLTTRRTLHNIKPAWSVNENLLFKFGDHAVEVPTHIDPRRAFPAFGVALMNSQRLISQEVKLVEQEFHPLAGEMRRKTD